MSEPVTGEELERIEARFDDGTEDADDIRALGHRLCAALRAANERAEKAEKITAAWEKWWRTKEDAEHLVREWDDAQTQARADRIKPERDEAVRLHALADADLRALGCAP